jgi:predicted enzyme related to lactoylglutathione lyase
MAQAKNRGRFVWQELMTDDTAAASAFYSKLLGWHAHASGGDPAYTEFHAGAKAVAGMMKMPDSAKSMGAKAMWMPYISVDEVDSAVPLIEGLGGKTIRPASDIPNVGRFAVVSDPQGAVFAVFTPNGAPVTASATLQPGEFSWMELATSDHEAAFTFYSKLFGWEAMHRHDMGPMGTYLIFGSEGVQRGGMFKMGPHHGGHPYWLPYAWVADADASAKVVTASGGRVVNGPMDVPGEGRIAQLTDPGGVLFAVHAQAKPAQPAAKPAAPAQAAAAPPKPAAAVPAAPKPAAKPAAVTTPPTLKPAAMPDPPKAATPAAAPVAAKKVPAKKKAAPKKKAAAKKKTPAKKKTSKAAPKKKAAKKAAKKATRKATSKPAAKASVAKSKSGKDKSKKDKSKKDKSKKDKKKSKKDKKKARRKK